MRLRLKSLSCFTAEVSMRKIFTLMKAGKKPLTSICQRGNLQGKGNILPSVDHLYVLSRLLKVHMEDLLVPKCEYSIVKEKYVEKSLGEKRLYEYWKRLCRKKCA